MCVLLLRAIWKEATIKDTPIVMRPSKTSILWTKMVSLGIADSLAVGVWMVDEMRLCSRQGTEEVFLLDQCSIEILAEAWLFND